MTKEPALVEIRRVEDGARLALAWEDGSAAELDARTLRGWCPCATCQGHGGFRIEFRPPPPGPIRVGTIEPVGTYGVSMQFSDGHATGIYRFDYLRELAGRADSDRPEKLPPTISRREEGA